MYLKMYYNVVTIDDTVDKNDKGVPLAGRVAKGTTMGCMACHANAEGGDYLFVND